jgi:hypothetical protein
MSEINAIATNNFILHNIDAKKLYVQEPLFTANSGDAVYVGWRPDETVLWENTTDKLTKDMTWPQTLSESISNFNKVKFLYGGDGAYAPQWFEFDVVNTNYTLTQSFVNAQTNNYCFYRNGIFSLNGTAFNNVNNYTLNYYGSTGMGDHNNVGYNKVSKIVGINRKENA